MKEPEQIEFRFATDGAPADEDSWHQQRRQATRQLGEKLGLPLGHRVQVRLTDGVVVEGRLVLPEEILILDSVDTSNLELRVGRTTFRHSDIAACVRMD